MPQLMPLFWILSSVMIMWILMFLIGLYYYVVDNELNNIESMWMKEGELVWWW